MRTYVRGFEVTFVGFLECIGSVIFAHTLIDIQCLQIHGNCNNSFEFKLGP